MSAVTRGFVENGSVTSDGESTGEQSSMDTGADRIGV